MRDELLQYLEAFQDFRTLIESLSDSLFLAPIDGWSPCQIVAHLTGWNRLMISACKKLQTGERPAYYAEAEDDYRGINAGFVARYAPLDRATLMDELLASQDELVRYLQSLESTAWEADTGVKHHRGGPATIGRTIASLSGDYRQHQEEIQAWVEARDR